MDEYIEELSQELIEALTAQGNDDLVASLVLLLGDFGIHTEIPEGELNENLTH